MRHLVGRCGLFVSLLVAATAAMAQGASADLALSKSGPATATAGSNVTYTLGVTNFGPNDSAGFTLNDPLPAGMTFVSLSADAGLSCTDPGVGNGGTVTCTATATPMAPALAAGASAGVSVVVGIPTGTPAGTTFTNIASVSSAIDPNDENDSGVVVTSIPVPTADVYADKLGPSAIGPDTDITYALAIGNGGPDAAIDATLSDSLPGTLTFVALTQTSGPTFACTTPAVGAGGTVSCVNASFAAGSSATFDLVAHVPAGTPAGTFYANTANASTSTPDNNAENDAAFTQATVSSVDVGVSKSAPPTVVAGQPMDYTVSLTNNGPDVALNAGFLDDLPARTSFVSAVQNSGPSGANCSMASASLLGCNIGLLPSGVTVSFTVTVLVDAATPNGSTLTNTATAHSDSFDTNATNDASSASTTVSNTADIAVSKSGPATVVAGSTATYTLGISNGGPDVAANVVLGDTLPPNTSFVSLVQTGGPVFACTTPAVGAGGTVSCTRASLAAGASASFDLIVAVSAAATNGSTIDNTAVASSTSPDANGENNAATRSATVDNSADLVASTNGPATVIAGANATYTLGIANNGAAAAANATLSDTLPPNTTFVSLAQASGPAFNCTTPAVGAGGTVTCTRASFAAISIASFTLVVAVGTGATNGSLIANTVDVSSSTVDPNGGNNSATSNALVSNAPDVVLGKTAAANIGAGQNLGYSVTVGNTGTSPATAVQWTDTLPAGTTFVSLAQTAGAAFACTTPAVGGTGSVDCSIASLAAGASATFTLVVKVDANLANGTVLTNTATATTTSVDVNPVNGSATASTTVTNAPDLAVSKTAAANIGVGQNLGYALGVSNVGVSPANTVQLGDTLPSGTTFVSLTQDSGPAFACTAPAVGAGGTVSCTAASLAAGASAAFTLVVKVDASVANNAVLTNIATATTASTDVNPANDSATADTTVTNAPDLVVVKSAPATVNAGQDLGYVLTVENAGVSPASAIQWSDALPAGTTFVSFAQTGGPASTCTTPAVGAGGTVSCTLPSLAAGTTTRFTLVVNVANSVANGTVLTNTATAALGGTDVNPGNNSGSASTTVSNAPDLAVTKTVTSSGAAGGSLVYAIGIANVGTGAANTVQLTDVLPSGTTFMALTQTGGPTFACTTPAVGSGGNVTCSIASLAAGAGANFQLVLGTTSTTLGAISNTASATAASADANTANNSATANVVLAAAAPIPALDARMLVLLALLLVGMAARYARRMTR